MRVFCKFILNKIECSIIGRLLTLNSAVGLQLLGKTIDFIDSLVGWFILSQTLGMLRDLVFILLHE